MLLQNRHSPHPCGLKGTGKAGKEVKSNITDNESAKITTSKGTLQGYNGIATVDKKHQIIVDAQAFGAGPEQHTLKPILESLEQRFQRLGINDDIYGTGAYITADTGFSDEANNQYLKDRGINGFVPDNQFRQRDPRFIDQKSKYGHHRKKKNKGATRKHLIPASEFHFDRHSLSCVCPNGERLSYKGLKQQESNKETHYFNGRLSQCANCPINHHCMQNPDSAKHGKGHGRQVSFTIKTDEKPTATDWMKQRVDSDHGKRIYSHRMSVVEPVFGNICSTKGLNRFSLRGKTKVQGQWQLFCMVHNIEKLANYGDMAA